MKTLAFLLLPLTLLAQSTTVPGDRVFQGKVDRSGASADLPRQGATLPATCSPGEMFLLTAYVPYLIENCVATNVWTQPIASLTVNGMPLLSPSLSPATSITPITGTGTVDLFTAPACTVGSLGCKRYLVDTYFMEASGGGTTTVQSMLKSNGVYYDMSVAATPTGPGQSGAGTFTILDPGQSISITCSAYSAGTYNAVTSVVAYESATPLKPIRANGIASGMTTVYTAPSNHSAIVLTVNGNFPLRQNANSTYLFDSSTPSGHTLLLHLVPPGGTPSAANAVISTVTASGNALATPQLPAIIPPGYSLVLEADYVNPLSTWNAEVYEY